MISNIPTIAADQHRQRSNSDMLDAARHGQPLTKEQIEQAREVPPPAKPLSLSEWAELLRNPPPIAFRKHVLMDGPLFRPKKQLPMDWGKI